MQSTRTNCHFTKAASSYQQRLWHTSQWLLWVDSLPKYSQAAAFKNMKQSSYLLYINLFWYLVATLWVTFLLWLKHWALHKQFGSVIFHKKCDFVKALSTALEKVQSIKGNWKPLHLQVQACQSLLLHLLWKKRSMKGLCILMQSFMSKPMYWSLSFMTVHQHTAI